MKNINVYEKGDRVMIKGTVKNVKVEDGVHKYQIRDDKSSNLIPTWYTSEEIVSCPAEKEKEQEEEE